MAKAVIKNNRRQNVTNARRGVRNLLDLPGSTPAFKHKKVKKFMGNINMKMSDISSKRRKK